MAIYDGYLGWLFLPSMVGFRMAGCGAARGRLVAPQSARWRPIEGGGSDATGLELRRGLVVAKSTSGRGRGGRVGVS